METESTVANCPVNKLNRADAVLNGAAAFWFLIAVLGQWMFALYIAGFYGVTSLTNETDRWSNVLHHGLGEGDFLGNLFLVLHLLLAFVITVGGPLQLLPKLRARAPGFHRWNGRIYIVTAFVISLAGLALIYRRGAVGGIYMMSGNTINAVLIICCAFMTWRTVLARQMDAHRRWAIRTFIVVSGVWFFRVGFGLWILLNKGGAPGHTDEFTGPFDIFLAFGHTLLPLAILEIYFRVRDRSGVGEYYVLATVLAVLAVAMGMGIFFASQIFWLPNL